MAIHETQLTTTSTQAAYRVHVVIYACALSAGKWPTVHLASNGGTAGSLQLSGFRENPTNF